MEGIASEAPGPVGIPRRYALGLGLALGLPLSVGRSVRPAMAQPHGGSGVCPRDVGQHNMLVFGEQRVFLSHLPMFMGLCRDRAHFATQHRFQLLLEASFEDQQTRHDVTDLYRAIPAIGPEQAIRAMYAVCAICALALTANLAHTVWTLLRS